MVDWVAVRDAWHDYWQHPEWTTKYIAGRHNLNYTSLYTLFTRAGYVKRRAPASSRSVRPDAVHCPGYKAMFCPFCPCPPACTEWSCHLCELRYECACTTASLRPQGWQEHLDEHKKEKARNKRAAGMYRYAWTKDSLEEP